MQTYPVRMSCPYSDPLKEVKGESHANLNALSGNCHLMFLCSKEVSLSTAKKNFSVFFMKLLFGVLKMTKRGIHYSP